MTTMVFDEERAAELVRLWKSPDIEARRRTALRGLATARGETVLDVGCGAGMFLGDLAEQIGPTGRVIGVDTSREMLTLARRTCPAAVELHEADAAVLPIPDGSVDAVICVQVLEYVADVPAVLGEMHRVLRPGGRVLIWDTDWTSLAWHSDDPHRMRQILDAWDEHLVHPALPRMLPAALDEAGFELSWARPFATLNLRPDPDTYSHGVIGLVKGFVVGRHGITQAVADAWEAELRALADAGRYYLCSLQFCVLAVKP